MLTKLTTIVVFAMGIFLCTQTIPTSYVSAAQKNKNERGQKLFEQYCASCHGKDGKGGGPVSASLKTAMPDLTTIEKRDGKFNQLKVQQIISGEVYVTTHGEKDMPVWGYIFRQKGGQSTSVANVYAMASYIKSMQQK